MVYIHAGEFMFGSSNDLENNWPYFSSQIILVTFNFRIGPLGFLGADIMRSRAANRGTGNYGMLDQRFALQWVHENVAAFGGDPGNVAIWGESSGATSVAYHLSSQPSWSFYQKAIMQSPGIRQIKQWEEAQDNFNYLVSTLAGLKSPNCSVQPFQYISLAGAELGHSYGHWHSSIRTATNESLQESKRWCDFNSSCAGFTVHSRSQQTVFVGQPNPIRQAQAGPYGAKSSDVVSFLKSGPTGEAALECLLSASAESLNGFAGLYMPRGDTINVDTWAPVLDGVDLAVPLEGSIGRGELAPNVDVLVGTNLDEASTFTYLGIWLPCNGSSQDLTDWARNFYGETLGQKASHLYSKIRKPIPTLGCASPAEAYWFAAAMRAASDSAFTCPVRELARSLAARKGTGKTFKYYFTHTPATSVNEYQTSDIGAFHGADVPFVFQDRFELTTPADLALSKAMSCYWSQFSSSGDPNGGSVCDLPKWPQYSLKNEVSFELSVDTNASLHLKPILDLQQNQCDLWATSLADPPFAMPHQQEQIALLV
eukprot:gnl/TRDRNA2_/TRDRNA2_169708_c1_seq1.p1 gnl/TRDRNA2_/TRDRNA2_169708_c1~~gnl/TRDRNA2_/TRDRNA2_169708_c1_seq1.p1  ORF type:complete len:571 (+),score=57.38 gnl/TRDRNA2_/TRDRNA2_169708_c1_seq1:95-1714(+)